jgi:hypothetical protein
VLPRLEDVQFWAFDTGFSDDVITSDTDLEDLFGLKLIEQSVPTDLNVDLARRGPPKVVHSPHIGVSDPLHLHGGILWIIGRRTPQGIPVYPIELAQGIIVQPGRSHSLIGRGAFLSGGIRLQIDYHQRNFSIVVPQNLTSAIQYI